MRSYRGCRAGWYRHARQTHQGRTRAGRIERDAAFEEPENADHEAINRAYRTKYARYSSYVTRMVSASATEATPRLRAR